MRPKVITGFMVAIEMKTILRLLLVLAVSCCVSCSKAGNEESGEVVISFYPKITGTAGSGFNVETDVKSSALTTANLSNFGVYAYSGMADFEPGSSSCSFMNNLKVYKPEGYGSWMYDGEPILWPYKNKISFFAYAPYISESGDDFISISYQEDENSKGSPVLRCEVPAKIDKSTDLLLSLPLYNQELITNGQVKLSFIHALSKFEFYAKTAEAVSDTREYTVEKISLEYVASNAYFSYPSATQVSTTPASVTEAIGNYTVTPNYEEGREYILANTDYLIENTVKKSGKTLPLIRDGYDFYLIPQMIERNSTLIKDVKITVIYTYNDEQGEEHTLTIQNTLSGVLRGIKKIEPCKRYRLTFVLSELSGDFNIDTEILPWESEIIDVPSFD